MIPISIYTSHLTDGIDKQRRGAVFAALIDRRGVKYEQTLYGQDDTYMTIWLKGVLQVLTTFKDVGPKDKQVKEEGLLLRIHSTHKNIYAISKKIESVFNELRTFNDVKAALIDRKMRKSNRGLYPYHDTLVSIVQTLLAIDGLIRFDFAFHPVHPRHPSMRSVHQIADIALDEATQQQPSNVIPIAAVSGHWRLDHA
jgi:hypothetical protein